MKKFTISLLLLISSFNIFASSTVTVKYSNNITRKATPQLTVAQYKNKVQSLFLEISKLGQTPVTKTKKINNTNNTMNMQIRQAQIIIDKGIPLYSQLIALNPPNSLAASHAKLKKGSQSALDILYMSKYLFQSLENPSTLNEHEIINRVEELHSKLNELQNNAHLLTEAIFEISGAN